MVKTYLGDRSTSKALRIGRTAGVPHLIFITDQTRATDPIDVCLNLPAGSIIICRDYDHPDRIGLAKSLRTITRKLSQFLLVAGDPDLAHIVGADGFHMPEYQLMEPPSLTSFGLVSAACHDHRALCRAERLGVDFALVSPVFETDSHPDKRALGVHRFTRLVSRSKVPVAALGGIQQSNAMKLRHLPLMGVAAIGAFIP